MMILEIGFRSPFPGMNLLSTHRHTHTSELIKGTYTTHLEIMISNTRGNDTSMTMFYEKS